ncbi:MAG: PfkB family carbohydrate kinase [Haloplanus sp.]
MPYDDLVARLSAGLDQVRVGAFPDGSVDDYYRLRSGESTVSSRAAFAAAITAGRDSFALDHVMTDAGGQAVNAARQAAALGDDVHLVGHLDHPIFDFDFETASMGAPARVRVCLFDADDVMFVEESADLAAWSFADLEDALDDVDDFLERDALCCVNWASVPGLGDMLADIASRTPGGGVFCIDPGPLSTTGAGDLLDALIHLDGYDVVVSVNDDEANRLATAAGERGADDGLDGVRDATGAAGVVVHGADAAVASTPSGTVSVPTLDVSRALTETGAGDRFSAGLARSLAAGWDWDLAVAMGNACAAHYVAGNGTGQVADLRAHVEHHRP